MLAKKNCQMSKKNYGFLKKIIKQYTDEMMRYMHKENEESFKQEKTEKQKTNWITMDDFVNVINEMQTEIKEQGLMKQKLDNCPRGTWTLGESPRQAEIIDVLRRGSAKRSGSQNSIQTNEESAGYIFERFGVQERERLDQS